MYIYFLKCLNDNFHNHISNEFLYIGKDSTGTRIYQHTHKPYKKKDKLHQYLNKAKENVDYIWIIKDNIENKTQLAKIEKKLILEEQPQFNKYLKGARCFGCGKVEYDKFFINSVGLCQDCDEVDSLCSQCGEDH